MELQVFWFATLYVLLAGYLILDGFDLGVGIMHPVARDDRERRILMSSIGPVWDGNEVWLITFGGALFAAFPHAYATAFSGFYSAFILLLFALIGRAISLEFRSKLTSPAARRFFDIVFWAGSALATLLLGVAAGNILQGLPIGPDMEFRGSLRGLLGAYPLSVGLLALALFAMHGCAYLCLKTTGELQQRLARHVWLAYAVFAVLCACTITYTLVALPHIRRSFADRSWLWAVVIVGILAIAAIAPALRYRRYGYAFICSSGTIATLVVLLAAAMYPNLLLSSLDADWNLTIYNASSSERSLRVMQMIALGGMPLVLIYSGFVHWHFRGKVELDKADY